jgi:hypothetical protein
VEPVAAEVGAELTDRKRRDRLKRAAKPPGRMQVPQHLVPAAVSARPPRIGGLGPLDRGAGMRVARVVRGVRGIGRDL